MTCKGIKREATCGFSFDFRSSQASKRNDEKKLPGAYPRSFKQSLDPSPLWAQDDNSNDQ